MSVQYFDALDEMIRETPKDHIAFANNMEATAVRNAEPPVPNPDFNGADHVDSLKIRIVEEIEAKTIELQKAGKDHNGIIYPFDKASIDDYLQVQTLLNRSGKPLGLPKAVQPVDVNLPRTVFSNNAEWDAFIDDMFGDSETKKDEDGALKEATRASKNLTELKAQHTANKART